MRTILGLLIVVTVAVAIIWVECGDKPPRHAFPKKPRVQEVNLGFGNFGS